MSFREWSKFKWGELCSLEYGKGLRDYKNSNEKIPVYGTNGLIGHTDKVLISRDGIVIGRKGAYRGVHYTKVPFYVIDTAFYIKLLDYDKLDMKFAYYNLLTKDINSMDSGSAIPSTSRSDFYSMTSRIPPLPEQKAIAHILSTLDEKIEVNNQINKTLEKMAQAIFKQWFVDFEFPNEEGEPYQSSGGEMIGSELGMIPKGWEVKKIGDIAAVRGGKRLPKGHTLTEIPTKHPYIRVTDISNGNIKIKQLMYITDETFKLISQYQITNEDIYISIAGTIGLVGTIRSDLNNPNLTENMAKLTFSEPKFKHLVYLFLKSEQGKNEISARTVGSTQQKLALIRIRDIPLILPKEVILSRFHLLIECIQSTNDCYLSENDNLERIRDALLPKLMSGEIRVSLV